MPTSLATSLLLKFLKVKSEVYFHISSCSRSTWLAMCEWWGTWGEWIIITGKDGNMRPHSLNQSTGSKFYKREIITDDQMAFTDLDIQDGTIIRYKKAVLKIRHTDWETDLTFHPLTVTLPFVECHLLLKYLLIK